MSFVKLEVTFKEVCIDLHCLGEKALHFSHIGAFFSKSVPPLDHSFCRQINARCSLKANSCVFYCMSGDI